MPKKLKSHRPHGRAIVYFNDDGRLRTIGYFKDPGAAFRVLSRYVRGLLDRIGAVDELAAWDGMSKERRCAFLGGAFIVNVRR